MQKKRLESRAEREAAKRKAWIKPIFKDLRLGFEITLYFWNR